MLYNNVINEILDKLCINIGKPDLVLDSVNEMELEHIYDLKLLGIKAIILDVDDTLRTNMGSIPAINREWINMINNNFKVIVLSNGKDYRIEKYFKSLGITYISLANKPLKKNFIVALDHLETKPSETLFIGNDIIADIYGAKRNDIKTAYVKKYK